MALQGFEWVVIIVVVGALIMFGPKKIPDLARSIGQARKEFDKASKGQLEDLALLNDKEEDATTDDALIETARKLGIDTLGKTRAEISKEIVDKYNP